MIAGTLFHRDNWTTDRVPSCCLHLPADICHVPHLSLQQCNVSLLTSPGHQSVSHDDQNPCCQPGLGGLHLLHLAAEHLPSEGHEGLAVP